MVKKIVLHGLFRRLAQESFCANVNSFNDLIGSLCANFDKLGYQLKAFSKEVHGFLLIVDNKIVESLSFANERIQRGKVIELIPIQKFNAYSSVTIAFTSIAASSFGQAVAYSVINIIVLTAISVGISYLMTKLLSPKQPKQVKTASYIFSSKENAVERNTPIPLNYGRLRLGTNVIATAGFSFDLAYADAIQKTSLSNGSNIIAKI